MIVVDTHAHLSDLEDKETIIGNARRAGVAALVAVGANYTTNFRTIEWARAYPGYVFPALGIHPTEFADDDVSTSLSFIRENIEKCVAVGEIGLDYWDREARKNKDVREQQRRIYTKQLAIAREHDLPTSVHGRGSWRDALKLAVEHGPETVVFHWYSGPLDVLSELLDGGYYISATPAAEYSRDHRAALENAPLERIIIETDSPVYMRNRRRNSEPADTVVTLGALAKLKDADENEVARVTTENAKKIFRI